MPASNLVSDHDKSHRQSENLKWHEQDLRPQDNPADDTNNKPGLRQNNYLLYDTFYTQALNDHLQV